MSTQAYLLYFLDSMKIEDLIAKERISRILRTSIPPPQISGPEPLNPTNIICAPPSFDAGDAFDNVDLAEALSAELTPEQRVHCAQGGEPFVPGSEEERMYNRMLKFGVPMEPVVEAPKKQEEEPQPQQEEKQATLRDFMTDAKMQARMAKFGTGPVAPTVPAAPIAADVDMGSNQVQEQSTAFSTTSAAPAVEMSDERLKARMAKFGTA